MALWDFSDAFVTFDNAAYLWDGTLPPLGNMPNLVGEYLFEAIETLQDDGIYVPASIGYFGTFPITVVWQQAPTLTFQQTLSTFTFGVSGFGSDGFGAGLTDTDTFTPPPGTVLAQTPPVGANATPNFPITLVVACFPVSVAFP